VLDPRWPFAAGDFSDRPIDVVCVGHALVDRLAYAGLDEVGAAGLEAGAMTLVDAVRAGEIERAFSHWREVAGGSAANTAAGVASLGGSPAFAGAVGDDAAGAWYLSDLARAGVECAVDTVGNGSTGVCHVLISGGGERTMATSLGAAGELALSTIEGVGLQRAKVVYVEGYLLDAAPASAAVTRALELAKEAGTLVSLTLSDPFVVDRHGERLRELVFGGTVDLLFGNEEEAMALMGAASRSEAAARLRRSGAATVVTLGAAGAMAITPDAEIVIEADGVELVEDTTGAGDLFAAGCLYGLTHELGPEAALRLGSFAAAEVISHVGARPAVSLRDAAGDRLSAR